MKKFTYFIIIISLLIFYNSNVLALTTQVTLNESNILINIKDDISNKVSSINILKFENEDYLPLRVLGETFGYSIEWNNTIKSVVLKNENNVISFRINQDFAYVNGNKIQYEYNTQLINSTTYVPVEAYKIFTNDYIDGASYEKDTTTIEDSIKIESGLNCDRIILSGDFEIEETYTMVNPNRFVIDLFDFSADTSELIGETFSQIRVSENRLVFDLNEKYESVIYQENNTLVFELTKDGTFKFDEVIPIEFSDDKVKILTSEYDNYSISRLSDPYKIIMTIPNTELVQNEAHLAENGEYVEDIGIYTSNGSTIVEVTTTEQCRFEIVRESDGITIEVYQPSVLNVIYHNNNDRKYIELKNIKLTHVDETTTKYHSETTTDGGLTYSITFEDSKYIFNEGQIYVNDANIKNIFVYRNGTEVTIEIQAKEEMIYTTCGYNNSSVINILPIIDEPFVVIVAGHGGFDPGAVYEGIYESNINLDIALKVEKELEALGIITYMIREDDTFVGVSERADIANAMGADLFVSIHNNAYEDENFKGLMTLSYSGIASSQPVNGKFLSTNIHNSAIIFTDATDLGIIDRDGLAVLRKTTMAATLIECGFMTNSSELSKLIDASYQDKLAKGISEGIINTFKYIGK